MRRRWNLTDSGNVAEIGGDGDLDAAGVEAEAHRIDGIVGDAEALHLDIAHHETGAGLKAFQARLRFAPIHGRRGELADINGDSQPAGDAREAGNVVGMLVGDQYRVERFGVLAGRFPGGGPEPLKLSPASTRMRVRSVASSAQLPLNCRSTARKI